MAATTAGLAMMPPSIRRALAIPARRVTGSIQDVEHVVILMQENRSFDHYFGSMRGVRGFRDPRPVVMTNGKTIWHQPPVATRTERYHSRGAADDLEYILPFYIDPQKTSDTAGTDHGWSSGHLAWNHGHHDQWVNQKQDVMTMGYLKREDVSFHYALADAFTVCDSYFCSIHADTAPNRIYLWSGTIDPHNRLGRKANGPGFDERHHVNGYTWTTYPERLEAAGISWKLYQGGTGEPGSPTDNYTDNSLEFFAAYQVKEGAARKGPLVQKGVTNRTLRQFRDDVISGRLAQVSWIVAPYIYSEHPEACPTDGAHYVNHVLDALTANPEVWSKTVFILNYDENDGLFDHMLPPVPPATQSLNSGGRVSPSLVAALEDEFIDMSKHPQHLRPLIPGADPGGRQPIGLGPRLPMLIVSPWTRGGWVCSEVFDHTSVLQFLEARFGVRETNITPWRRSICGDLTSAFDFSATPAETRIDFSPPQRVKPLHQPYVVPEAQTMPAQEPGTRPARPLPYRFYTHSRLEAAAGTSERRIWIDFENQGRAGAAFYVFNGNDMQAAPRRYSIASEERLSDFWPISDGSYNLSLWGPNGYHAQFQGAGQDSGPHQPEVELRYDPQSDNVALKIANSSTSGYKIAVANKYAPGNASHGYELAAGEAVEDRWELGASAGWFDLSVSSPDLPGYLRRYAGHVETGRPSTSDPGMLSS